MIGSGRPRHLTPTALTGMGTAIAAAALASGVGAIYVRDDVPGSLCEAVQVCGRPLPRPRRQPRHPGPLLRHPGRPRRGPHRRALRNERVGAPVHGRLRPRPACLPGSEQPGLNPRQPGLGSGQHGLASGPGGGPPAVTGCGYGAVAVWAPLADPVNVAFLAGAAGGANAFVVAEPGSASAIGVALLGLMIAAQ
jgi:hypothetical protein